MQAVLVVANNMKQAHSMLKMPSRSCMGLTKQLQAAASQLSGPPGTPGRVKLAQGMFRTSIDVDRRQRPLQLTSILGTEEQAEVQLLGIVKLEGLRQK